MQPISEKERFEEKQHVKYVDIEALGSEETEGLLDDEVFVTEKVDGANFQYQIFNDELIFGSKSLKLDPNTKIFIAIKAVKDAYNKNPKAFSPFLIYYGESMQPHTLLYDYAPPFIGLDVMEKSTRTFLPAEKAKKLFEEQGLPFVPILMQKQGK